MAAANEPAPYRFDPDSVSALQRLLDDAAMSVEHYFGVPAAVVAATDHYSIAGDDPAVTEMVSVFNYRLRVPHAGADVSDASATLNPLDPPPPGTFAWPLALRLVGAETRTLWAALGPLVEDAACRARLEDALFCLGEGNTGDHGRAAVEAYLEAVGGHLGDLDEMQGLVRAWTLARMMKSEVLEARAIDAMKSYADTNLASDNSAPGVALPLLRALTTGGQAGSDRADPDVDRLLDRAMGRFGDSYIIGEIAAITRHWNPGSPSAADATRAEVQALLDEAGRAPNGQVRMHFLNQAAGTARRRQLPDLEAQAVTEMQAMKPEDIEWASIRSDFTMPKCVVEGYLRAFDEGHSWRFGVCHFLSTESPTASYDANEAAARASTKQTPLRSLFATVRFGPHGLPQQTISGDQEKLDERIVEFERHHMAMTGQLLADGLERVRDHYGAPDREELLAFLVTTYRSDAALLGSLADALIRFWAGDYDTAIYLAVPRIEAGVRGLLLLLDQPLYQVEVNRNHGQFPAIGALLPHLVPSGFDPDWERFLGTFLLVRGDNFRNFVAHGFVYRESRWRAALAIRALGLVATVAPSETAALDRELVHRLIEKPVSCPVAFPLAWWARSRPLAWLHGRVLRRRLRVQARRGAGRKSGDPIT